MEWLVSLTPDECLDSAARYMVDEGYSIELRTENTLEVSRSPRVSSGTALLAVLASIFTFGITFLALIIVLVFFKWKATVIAIPAAGGRTRLTANSPIGEARRTLEQWAHDELREKEV